MWILLNDEQIEFNNQITINELLKQINQLKPGIAIALNKEILPKEQWSVKQIKNGDNILVFQIITGG